MNGSSRRAKSPGLVEAHAATVFAATVFVAIAVTATVAFAEEPAPDCSFPGPYKVTPAPGGCHPYPQPYPEASRQTTTGCPEACQTDVETGDGIYPASYPFLSREFETVDPERFAGKTFPGTNFLPTIYTNMFDSLGNEMVNTLPSTPHNPYNLHDGEPVVSQINPDSPTDDLAAVFDLVLAKYAEWRELVSKVGSDTAYYQGEAAVLLNVVQRNLQLGIDILEGNPVENRAYSGLPMLHYNGPLKVRRVEPIHDPATGEVVSGNVDVHQAWFDQHIESDTAFLDASEVDGVPWTVTYSVDVLSRGHDDFSPWAMFFDRPADGSRKPHVGMDQTFFDMEEGTRTVFKIKMPPGKYLNLIYTWGWRFHPPRIQVMENAAKTIDYGDVVPPVCPGDYQGKTLPQLEEAVFGSDPRGSEQAKLAAIAKIGDLSPAKRMWRALRDTQRAIETKEYERVKPIIRDRALPAFADWRDRTRLPAGVEPDPGSDLTMLYVNNTIYGELTNGGWVRWDDWKTRFSEWQAHHPDWESLPQWEQEKNPPPILDLTLYNGDHYVHGYVNVDFGGNRGWENQFKSSVRVAGSGCWFTFGRAHWWMNAGGTKSNGWICVPQVAQDGTPGKHKIKITFNFDPSRRIRFYQFDPFHHDVAIYSIH